MAMGETYRDAMSAAGQPRNGGRVPTYAPLAICAKAATVPPTLNLAQQPVPAQPWHLEERVRHLECLNALADLNADQSTSLDHKLRQAAGIIAAAWPSSIPTGVRIALDGKQFMAPGFRATGQALCSDLVANGKQIGTLEIFCLEPSAEGGRVNAPRFEE